VDSTRPDDCVVYFPISFALALKVDGAGCAPVVDVALGATPQWDVCWALGAALGVNRGKLLEAAAYVGAAYERSEPDVARLEFGFGSPLVGPTRPGTVGSVQVPGSGGRLDRARMVCWTTAWHSPDAGDRRRGGGVCHRRRPGRALLVRSTSAQ
jgi:hypothetical protein